MSSIERLEQLNKIIKNLPDHPGIYKYFDAESKIIYIGKAKNLKKRVASYFNKVHDNRKTAVLVNKIEHIEFTIVDSEIDALLLENSLIKKHQPRFNILLKDDKTYPSIKITNERFPKFYSMRNRVKDGSEYFGPYANSSMMHTILDLIRTTIPTRNCNLNLSASNIKAQKFKVCLEYHIGNCKGPCVGLQSEEDYLNSIAQIREILKGNIAKVIAFLKQSMNQASVDMHFEKAALMKHKLESLENYQSKSTIVSNSLTNIDVFSLAEDEKYAFVNFLKVVNGMIIQTKTLEYKKMLDESAEEVLEMAIAEVRDTYQSDATEIIVPFEMQLIDARISFIVPKAGEKKKLLDLSFKNALYYKKDRLDQYEKVNPELRVDRLLGVMRDDLRLSELPKHIECFDNSNFQGAFPVSAMVCFKDGKPSKKDYRHYNVQTVEGPDDFATMYEVITRRYKRLRDEHEPFPQLIVVDGGKGQLSSAMQALKDLGLYGQIAMVGIAKRLEEIYYPDDPLPLHIDKKSETLRILQQMRDEVHRFGITHHRSRRDKGTLKNELEAIKGIGPETAEQLLRELKSVKKIKEAPLELLENIVGKAKAKLVADYFKL
ncbi:MAG: excinuclease ABC subunit UvrC [Bacteroidetes bacterium]|nr:excinuclease ABC subunit UvrC [Bacteroidota bacterium]